jgi:hypothetical protein
MALRIRNHFEAGAIERRKDAAMPSRSPLFAAASLLLLAGCSTIVPRGSANLSPAGQTLQVIASNGAESRMQFRPNGEVIAAFGDRSITGEWQMQDEGLCFRWGAAPIECWPHTEPFERGRSVTVTSTRGNTVRVTRL